MMFIKLLVSLLLSLMFELVITTLIKLSLIYDVQNMILAFEFVMKMFINA